MQVTQRHVWKQMGTDRRDYSHNDREACEMVSVIKYEWSSLTLYLLTDHSMTAGHEPHVSDGKQHVIGTCVFPIIIN